MADKIKIRTMVLGMCQTNCYFFYREKEASGQAEAAGQAGAAGRTPVIVVDPADQGEQIYEALRQKGFDVKAILLTHGHFDHIWGVNALRRLSNAPVYAWEGGRALLEDAQLNVSAQAGRAETVQADHYVKDESTLSLEGFQIKVIATPGHTQGSCCYYLEEEGVLFSGDTLFEGSVGRTDLPTGSMSSLVRSIKEKLLVLPEAVQVFSGHGGQTTIGDEKRYNPYCR